MMYKAVGKLTVNYTQSDFDNPTMPWSLYKSESVHVEFERFSLGLPRLTYIGIMLQCLFLAIKMLNYL